MFHSVNKLFSTEYVYVKVMSTLVKVTIHNLNKIVLLFFF